MSRASSTFQNIVATPVRYAFNKAIVPASHWMWNHKLRTLGCAAAAAIIVPAVLGAASAADKSPFHMNDQRYWAFATHEALRIYTPPVKMTYNATRWTLAQIGSLVPPEQNSPSTAPAPN